MRPVQYNLADRGLETHSLAHVLVTKLTTRLLRLNTLKILYSGTLSILFYILIK
jgi:hypothetical protein